jgi:prepilin-type N-terminal cleavage/methylation domain-containing protein
MSRRDLGTVIWNERGLTLAEILVATVIIAIGLVGLAVVVPVASYGVQEGNQLSTATFLAEQRIEQARNKVWTGNPLQDCLGVSSPSTSAPATTADCAGTAAGAVSFADESPVAGFTGYNRTTRIIDCSTTTCAGLTNPANMRRVTVTVSYRPLTGSGVAVQDKNVSVEWVVTRR